MNRSIQATKGISIFGRNLCTVLPLVLALAGLVGCQGFSSGNSTPPPTQLQASLSTVAFGSVKVGNKQTQSETLSNPGTAAINLTGATVTGAAFSVSGLTLPSILAGGQSIAFTVTFTPKSAAAATGSVAVLSDASNSNLTIALSGTGTTQTPQGQLSISPTSINFGSVAVGSSQTKTATLTAASASVTISAAPSISAPFSISGLSFPLTLTAGQSATFSFTFAPQSSGSTSQNISFASDASNSPTVIALSGTGTTSQTGQLSISPSSINFGSVAVGSSQTKTATLNAAGASVTISSAPSISAPFSISGLTFPLTLTAGQAASFSFTFTPQSSGAASQNISFASNASNSPTVIALSGTGTVTQKALAHGMYVLNPPSSDNDCNGLPASCFSQHMVPTLICTGNGTPAGYNCTQQGAGEPFVKGAAFQTMWSTLNSADGTYDFTSTDNRMKPWVASGKLVSFVFEPTSFGTTNNGTPAWYETPVQLSSISQTSGIITVQTSTPMTFFPGGASSASGLEIQIVGTGTALDGNGTSSSPGIWQVCNHTTPGCQDPTSQTVYAIGSGPNVAPVVNVGTVGNPLYGSNDGSTCTSGMLPIQWRPNFIRAWKNFIQAAVAHYGTNSSISYLRFGMGVGGQTNPTNGLSTFDTNQTACQAQMTKYGFTSTAAPWPAPGTTGWSQVAANWTAYLKTMAQYEQSLNPGKPIILTISPIQFSPVDLGTPDATATNAVAAGIGFGNQGLQKSDPINYGNGQPCYGGDWCANIQKYQGQVSLELQTLSMSDPTNTNQMGSLAPSLLTFATGLGARILELYIDDWMCTYDNSWNGNNTYAACTSAGYPAVFSAAAAQIN